MLYHFNKLKPSTKPMAKFNSHLSDESDQDSSTTATYLHNFLHFLLTKVVIAPFLTKIWNHMNGCAKQYRCEYDMFLPSCIDLYFSIIIKRLVGSTEHGKDVVDGLNSREKWMLKLAI